MVPQGQRASAAFSGWACLGALLVLRLAAVYAANTDLVLDEAPYWTWSRELAFGYQMTRPFTAETPEPILCVSLKRCPSRVTKPFGTFESLGIERVKLVKADARAAFLQAGRLQSAAGARLGRPGT